MSFKKDGRLGVKILFLAYLLISGTLEWIWCAWSCFFTLTNILDCSYLNFGEYWEALVEYEYDRETKMHQYYLLPSLHTTIFPKDGKTWFGQSSRIAATNTLDSSNKLTFFLVQVMIAAMVTSLNLKELNSNCPTMYSGVETIWVAQSFAVSLACNRRGSLEKIMRQQRT